MFAGEKPARDHVIRSGLVDLHLCRGHRRGQRTSSPSAFTITSLQTTNIRHETFCLLWFKRAGSYGLNLNTGTSTHRCESVIYMELTVKDASVTGGMSFTLHTFNSSVAPLLVPLSLSFQSSPFLLSHPEFLYLLLSSPSLSLSLSPSMWVSVKGFLVAAGDTACPECVHVCTCLCVCV